MKLIIHFRDLVLVQLIFVSEIDPWQGCTNIICYKYFIFLTTNLALSGFPQALMRVPKVLLIHAIVAQEARGISPPVEDKHISVI